MKLLNFLALLFVLTVLPVSAQIGPDGTGVVNGYQIGPDADLIDANLSGGGTLIHQSLFKIRYFTRFS